MNYHYCQACFKKTPQITDVVNFCSHCGKSFLEDNDQPTTSNNIIISTTTPQHRQTFKDKSRERLQFKNRQKSTNHEDDETDDLLDDNSTESNYNAKVPNINKLDLEVDITQDRPAAIGSIAQGIKRQPKPENTNNKKVKLNKKQFWAQYQKEASSIRKK